MPSSDLLRRLRAADAALATMSPGAHLEARIRARARGRGAPRLLAMFVGVRRHRRPLILAFAAAAAALYLVAAVRGRDVVDPSRIAGGPDDPAEFIRDDRARSDGGPREPRVGERRYVPPPVLHMPGLTEPPQRLEPKAPPPSPTTPRSASPPSGWRDEPDDDSPAAARPAAPRVNTSRAPSFPIVGAPAPAPAAASSPRPFALGPGARSRRVVGSMPPSASIDSESTPDVDCKTPDTLKEIALSICEAQGLVLSTFTSLDPCGDGRFRSLDYECSKPESASSQCVQGYLGDSSTCHALGDDPKDPFAGIQQQVDAACAQMGLVVSQWSYDGTVCPAPSGSVSYLCCPSAAPGPDPSGCSLDQAGGGYCVDQAELLLMASKMCAKGGRELGDVTPVAGSGCPEGQAGWVQYACCDPAAP